MDRAFTIAGFVVAGLASTASGQTVTFDFNSLGRFDRDRAISEYMTDLYGSPVSTDGARATNERSDDPAGAEAMFIATSFQLLQRGDFIILFENVPISGAQFEGHVIDATVGDDFRFRAFNGQEEVLSFSRNDGVEIFDTEWFNFPEPVDRLVFSDSGRKDVGVDDLVVQPVPEPATGLLAFLAVTAMLRRRRRRWTPCRTFSR